MMRTTEKNSLESSSEFFDFYIDKMVGVLDLKSGVYEIATNLQLKEDFFNKIRLANRLPEIKVLLVLSDRSALGEEGYIQFEKSIRESADKDMQLIREENALSQYIRLVSGSEKIVISGVRGSVIGAFLGAVLSTDYRVASEDTMFSFLHIKYEISPQGALGFFLPRYVGTAKAKKILFNGDPIPAAKAYELGLVDEIIADDVFEEKCLEIAQKLAEVPPHVVALTRHQMRGELGELEAYLKMEADIAAGFHSKLLSHHERNQQ